MVAFLEQHDSVIAQSRSATPNDHVTMAYWHQLRLVGSIQPAEEEYCRNTKLDGDYRGTEISFVFILMQ